MLHLSYTLLLSKWRTEDLRRSEECHTWRSINGASTAYPFIHRSNLINRSIFSVFLKYFRGVFFCLQSCPWWVKIYSSDHVAGYCSLFLSCSFLLSSLYLRCILWGLVLSFFCYPTLVRCFFLLRTQHLSQLLETIRSFYDYLEQTKMWFTHLKLAFTLFWRWHGVHEPNYTRQRCVSSGSQR